MAFFSRKKEQTPPPSPAEPNASSEQAVADAAAAQPQAGGFMSVLKRGLSRTKQLLNTDVRDLFKAEGRLIDEPFLEELLAMNIKTDMGVKAANEIVNRVRTDMRGRVVQMDEVVESWKGELKRLMSQAEAPIRFAASGPTVIMVCGVNGSGKTTSIAKLAYMLKSQGKSVVLGAGDTFRAAAVEQLTLWATRLGVGIVRTDAGTHPATVAYKTVEKALAENIDVCIIDTAGRLQTQVTLMAELTKIKASISKQIPEAPHEVLLVLEGTTGQNGISQAIKFTEAVNCTGIVLSKLDGTAKGGVVVAIRQQVGLPVKYIGVGEQAEDLALFKPDDFVDALFADLK